MEPDFSAGFFSMPWPNDIRVHGDGTIDLDAWPGIASNPLAAAVAARGSSVTSGFGTNAAIYFQTSAPLDATSLPSPEKSLGDSTSVMLVNLDAAGTSPHPVILDFKNQPTTFRPGNLLTLLPYPGHPLAGTTRYAAILFEGLRDVAGGLVRPAPLLAALDDAWDASKPVGPSAWAALQAQRDEVFAYVAQHTGRAADQILGFTVFTTQDVHSEMTAIARAVEALPAPAPVSRSLGNCASGGYSTVLGQLDLPKWQQGTSPYLTDGGAIVIAGGVAVQQSTERVDFSMTFPCGSSPSPSGWPILLFMDGTTGCARSSSIPYVGYAPLPFVVASIAPLYSCDRFPGGQVPTDQLAFNYLNPLAGRTNQLQQAADMLYLKRVIQGITLATSETGAPDPVETNDGLVAIAGHSQGALTVPHALAVDPQLHAGFISAGGGGLYHALVHRADERPQLEALLGLKPGELDMFHPVLHALQTIAEVGDAANYGRDVTTAHVLSVGGVLDGCSVWEVVSTLGTALGLQLAHPIFHPTFGSLALEPPIVGLPAVANLPGQRTGVTVQLDTGHFGTITNPNLGRSFLESFAASGGAPTIDPGVLLPDSNQLPCPDRFDPLH
jgi:hypothetical protein